MQKTDKGSIGAVGGGEITSKDRTSYELKELWAYRGDELTNCRL